MDNKKHLFKTVRNNTALTMCSYTVKDSRYLSATPIGYYHISLELGLALGSEETTCLDCLRRFLKYKHVKKEAVQGRIAQLEQSEDC